LRRVEMRSILLAEMRRLDDPFRFSNQPEDGLPAVPKPASRPAKEKAKSGDGKKVNQE